MRNNLSIKRQIKENVFRLRAENLNNNKKPKQIERSKYDDK